MLDFQWACWLLYNHTSQMRSSCLHKMKPAQFKKHPQNNQKRIFDIRMFQAAHIKHSSMLISCMMTDKSYPNGMLCFHVWKLWVGHFLEGDVAAKFFRCNFSKLWVLWAQLHSSPSVAEISREGFLKSSTHETKLPFEARLNYLRGKNVLIWVRWPF